jgi:protein SCO1
MSAPPEGSAGSWRGFLIGGPLVVALVIGVVVGLGAASGPRQATATPPPSLRGYLVEPPTPAPTLALTAADGRAFVLDEHRAALQLVFFGYTHCPDVCPATLGTIAQAVEPFGDRVEASMVTVDPERDTVAFLADYGRYLPAAMHLLTGSADQIRAVADDWGVRYARVDRVDGSYSMSHTADVFLVDRAGMLRAVFPFGTTARDIETVLGYLDRQSGVPTTPAPSRPATPSPTTDPAPASPAPASASPTSALPTPTGTPAASAAGDLRAAVVSTSVWAGGSSPVIFALYDSAGRVDDMEREIQVTLHNGVHAVGQPVSARPVKPAGLSRVFYVATLDIPIAGDWQARIISRSSAGEQATLLPIVALHPADTPALGQPAPSVGTPTLRQGEPALPVTTDPNPEPRLYRTSTADALAEGRPFVLVIDSYRFQVTPACGTALVIARTLLDRWPETTFIHLEPYRYSVVTSAPVLDGTLEDPPLVPAAEAWGLGPEPWDAQSMPWVFVVDGEGRVIAKYQGLVGTEDVDVILSMLEPST